MLIPILLTLAAEPQQPGSATHLEVRPDGAHWVSGRGTPPAAAGAGNPAAPNVTARWEDNHSGLAWIGTSAAVGDYGAVIMAGKELNNEAATAFASGSATPLFSTSHLGAEKVRVAVSARTPLAATIVHVAVAAGNYQATVTAHDTTGGGTPLWSYTFPAGGGVLAGEVMISGDGQRVVAVTGSTLAAQNMVRVFDTSGALLNVLNLPAPGFVRQARLSDDGRRLYLGLYNGLAEIWDMVTGSNLLSYVIGSSFDAHALAGDGQSFAYGDFGGLHVVRETSPGSWNPVAFMPVSAGGQYLGYADLDEDGSHAAWMQQRYSPAYDHIEIGLFDVAANAIVWSDSHDAPGTSFQLVASGVQISGDGTQVAGCSWGDSLNATPEVFAYDAAGAMSMSLDTPGSAFALDMDAAGDVVAAGTKAVHANTFGNGGSVFCAEPYAPTLQLLGVPKIGGSLTLTTPGGANALRVVFCALLGPSASPVGTTEVLLASIVNSVGPVGIPTGGLSLNLNVPGNPALAGRVLHAQGVRLVAGGGTLTNKVSVRLVP